MLLAALLGISLRLWLASKGHNFDVQSWTIAAELAAEGKNVYANTWRYPYGPVWFNILVFLKWVHDSLDLARLGPESFHIVMAGFLSLADIGVMLLLYRWAGLATALFYLLNPLSTLLTGFHSQIDTLALLPALGAWMLLIGHPSQREITFRRLLGSAVLMGFSLMTKHIMLFFPLWLLMRRSVLGPFHRRILYAAVAYGLLIGSFLPYAFDEGAWKGVSRSVVRYGGLSSTSFLVRVVDLMVPVTGVDSLFGLADGIHGMKVVMAFGMLGAGLVVMRREDLDPFLCYLPSLLIFSPMMADQYLAIPMITCAVLVRHWPVWIYTILGMWIVQWSAYEHGAFSGPKPWWRNFTGSGLGHQHAIFWLVVLLFGLLKGFIRQPVSSKTPAGEPEKSGTVQAERL